MKSTLLHLALALTLVMAGTTSAQPRERGPEADGPPREHRDRKADAESSRRSERLPTERIDEAIATIREMHPDTKLDWLARLENLAEKKPEEAAKRLARFPRILELMDAREKRPKEFALHVRHAGLSRELMPLLRQYNQAKENDEPEKLEKLKQQISERVEAIFQVRIDLKRIELQRQRKRLEKAEQELDDIETNSEALIQEKLKEMLEQGPRGPRGEDAQGNAPRERDRIRQRIEERNQERSDKPERDSR